MTATWKAIGQIIPDAKSSYKQIHEDDNLKAVEFHLFVFLEILGTMLRESRSEFTM